MKALKAVLMICLVVVTSCYFFPFVLKAFPVANSKMILAVVGLVMLGINLSKKGNAILDKGFLNLTLWAFAISIIAFMSMTFNYTRDNTFATYFMSMWVWLGGAYAVICCIKGVHGGVSVPLVVNYLIAVSVVQCILALVFNGNPGADEWQTDIFTGEGYMGNPNDDRLHGIGCALDVAGFRFSAVIFMAAYMLCQDLANTRKKWWVPLIYITAICFISIVGNMISRSTVIGTAVALIYIIYIGIVRNKDFKLFTQLTLFIVVAVAICISLYNSDESFKANLRFGFEGFFSLAETGKWETHSNDILKEMVVWPDNMKTWLIGDGYFNNPADKSLDTFDPYYTGESFGGYYMATDIGYLRYIFYFGIFGLIAFSLFLVHVCRICVRRFPMFKWLFIVILAINFIQWFKVSSDLFMVFAPFLCITAKENRDWLDRIEANQES